MEANIDNLINHPKPFHLDEKIAKKMKSLAFKEAFLHHFNNCKEFKNYCEASNVKPDDINSIEDLIKIPPIPSDVFRDVEKPISSVPQDKILLIATTSSTTSSKPGRYPLDAITLRRTTQTGIQFLKDINFVNGSVFMLTPSPDESDTGLVKGMTQVLKTGLNFGSNIYFSVTRGEFETERTITQIKNCKIKPRHFYGPPFAYMHLVEHLQKNKIILKLDNDSRLVTTGGWKTVKRDVSKEQFNELLCNTFGIRENQIRDAYGLTDIYTMIPECENHKKHVPPWIHISSRDPQNIDKEVAEGETGLLVLMSCFVNSYPAFVTTGDMGAVWTSNCECGRKGQIVEHRGRITKLGARGCAIRLEQFMSAITKK